jgi:UDP-3-O-[3-hydroxymyristoyl] glucosamine N-acyltransferase
VKIGSYCHLRHYTFVMDNDQHDVARHTELPQSDPVIVEDHVWIGSKAVVLPGVRIGSRAVIGAGSIVTKDVPPRCVAAGRVCFVTSRSSTVSGGSTTRCRSNGLFVEPQSGRGASRFCSAQVHGSSSSSLCAGQPSTSLAGMSARYAWGSML